MSSRPPHKLWFFFSPGLLGLLLPFLSCSDSYETRLKRAERYVDSWRLPEAEVMLAKLIRERPSDVRALNFYGKTLLLRGELYAASSVFEELLDRDCINRLEHEIDLALNNFYLGRLDLAASYARSAESTAAENGDVSSLVRCFNILGLIAFNEGRYESAEFYQRESFALARTIGDVKGEADALRQLGVLAWYAGHPDSALVAYYEPSLALYREIRDRMGEATALSNIGVIHAESFNHGESLSAQLEAFRIRKEIGDQRGLADSYYFLMWAVPPVIKGKTFMVSYIMRSLELSTSIGYMWGREVALRALALAHLENPDIIFPFEAIEDSVLGLSGEGRFYLEWSRAHRHLRRNEWEEAVRAYDRVLNMCDSMGYKNAKPFYLVEQARALKGQGRRAEAKKTLIDARGRTLSDGRPRWRVAVDVELARLHLDANEHRDALEILEPLSEFLDSLYRESLRAQGSDLGVSLAAATVHEFRGTVYSLLVNAAKENSARAFDAVERERALPFWGSGLTSSGSVVEHPYAQAIRDLEAFLDRPDRFASVKQLQTNVVEAIQSIMNDSKTLAAMELSSSTNTVATLRDVQLSLHQDEVLLEYFVGREDVHVLVVRSDTVAQLSLEVGSRKLHTALDVFREMLLRGKDDPTDNLWRHSSYAIYADLFQPLIDKNLISQDSRLIIAPHGSLHLLPFQALLTTDSGTEFLIERYSIEYVPSATQLTMMRRSVPSAPTSLVTLAADRRELRHAEEEIASIPSGLFRKSLTLRGKHTRSKKLLEEIVRHDVIHIAAHARMNPLHPLYSSIHWSGERLELRDILRQRMSARLVVLSACESGVSTGALDDIPEGHDMVSFPRAFLSIGAGAVVATLWIVEDETAPVLLSSFYANLAESHSLSSSLVRAQRQFIADARSSGKSAHPFYWAGFFLVGDGR